MRILLLGEYSNVHATLAEGLRKIGHQVLVVSNGDFWKNYPRDIDVARPKGWLAGSRLYARILGILPRLKGFDVVQAINPMFFELKAKRLLHLYHYIRKHNRKMVLGAFGMDYYWVQVNSTTKPLRYSDFNIGSTSRDNADAVKERQDWVGTDKEQLNRIMADDCDAIVAGLYEYWACYHPLFPRKTQFIPFPIHNKDTQPCTDFTPPLKLFVGISRGRNEYKGTDIMLRAAEDVCRRHPHEVVIRKAEGVPFAEYVKLMRGSDAILDQLYSYTPSMNPLEAMTHGIICVGGVEPENYEIIGEHTVRPIINVHPNYDSVVEALEWLVANPGKISELKRQSVAYVERHHNYIKVARQYAALYKELLSRE